jgi:hypothetical protein
MTETDRVEQLKCIAWHATPMDSEDKAHFRRLGGSVGGQERGKPSDNPAVRLLDEAITRLVENCTSVKADGSMVEPDMVLPSEWNARTYEAKRDAVIGLVRAVLVSAMDELAPETSIPPDAQRWEPSEARQVVPPFDARIEAAAAKLATVIYGCNPDGSLPELADMPPETPDAMRARHHGTLTNAVLDVVRAVRIPPDQQRAEERFERIERAIERLERDAAPVVGHGPAQSGGFLVRLWHRALGRLLARDLKVGERPLRSGELDEMRRRAAGVEPTWYPPTPPAREPGRGRS